MKKSIAAAILAVASTTAFAADTYVFGNVGHTSIDTSIGNASDVALGAGIGINVNEFVGFELSYVDFGQEEDLHADAFTLSAVGRYPLAHGFVARGKVGLANSGVYIKSNDVQEGYRGTDLMMGLGIEYKVAPEYTLVAEYERFKNLAGSQDVVAEQLNADRVSFGVQYHF